MTVSAASQSAIYQGNGSTTSFPIPGTFYDVTDVKVWLRDLSTTPPTETAQTNLAQGFVSGSNFVFTVAPTAQQKVVIKVQLPLTQGTSYLDNAAFQASSQQQVQDRAVLLAKQVQEQIDRSLKLANSLNPGSTNDFDPTLPQDIATPNASLVVDATGKKLVTGPSLSTITGAVASAAAAASSASAAATSATAAAGSATAASGSASAAATSATAAASSATSAASSAASVYGDLANTTDVTKGETLVGHKASGTGAVARTLRSFLSDLVISVKDYGALGDGTTDDSTALANAAAALQSAGGGTLFFPKGTYKHTGGTLTINASGIRILGDGATISTSLNGILFSLGGTGTGARQERILVEGIKFVAATIGTGGQQAIQFNYCRTVMVRNCSFQDFAGTGVKANSDCWFVVMQKNTCDNIGTIALYVEGDTVNPNSYVWFLENRVSNFQYGIEAKMTSNVFVIGNHLETGIAATTKYAILVTRAYSTGAEPVPQNVIIANNIVKSPVYQGINLTAVADYVVTGNIVESSGNNAIVCSGSRGTCSHNVVKNCVTGISVNYNSNVTAGSAGLSSSAYATAQATVIGNRVYGTTSGESYSFNGCDESIIAYNTCQAPSYAGYAYHLTSCTNTQFLRNVARGGSMTFAYRLESAQTGLTFRDNQASGFSSAALSDPGALVSAGVLTVDSTGLSSPQTQLPIAQGGTGQATANAALNALLPSQATNSGKFMTTDGTNTSWASQASAPQSASDALSYGMSSAVATNALTLALKQADGSTDPTAGNPVKISFRTTSTPSNGFNQRSVTGALSLTVPSSATLGHASTVQGYVYLYALDNAGTVELAVSGVHIFDEGALQSTTALSSSATSGAVLYSTTARTGVPIRFLGRFTSTQTTAGTWAAAMSDAALAQKTMIGIGGSEPINCRYTNTAGSSVTVSPATQSFATKAYDTHGAYNTSTGVFKAPDQGRFSITCGYLTAAVSLSTAQALQIGYKINGGTNVKFATVYGGGVSRQQYVQGTTTVKLNAGDTFEITINSDVATTLDVTAEFNFLTITKVG